MAAAPIPAGYHSVTPYLIVAGADAAIAFYVKAFGATEILRMAAPDGVIGHAELQIGDSRIMLADEHPPMGVRGPASLGGAGVHMLLYVEDCTAVFAQALRAGAKQLRPMQDQFYGDRSGTLTDPFGHQWTVATHLEDIDAAEMQRRMQEASSQ